MKSEVHGDIFIEVLQTNSPETLQNDEVFSKLSEYVNELINNDFSMLVQLLYRIDVSENKLRNTLASEQNNNAAELIAALIIERQIQKIHTRKHFKESQHSSEEERW